MLAKLAQHWASLPCLDHRLLHNARDRHADWISLSRTAIVTASVTSQRVRQLIGRRLQLAATRHGRPPPSPEGWQVAGGGGHEEGVELYTTGWSHAHYVIFTDIKITKSFFMPLQYFTPNPSILRIILSTWNSQKIPHPLQSGIYGKFSSRWTQVRMTARVHP